VRVPILNFVRDNAVEPFLGREREQFVGERDVFLGGEPEGADQASNLGLRAFNAPPDLDFLLAAEGLCKNNFRFWRERRLAGCKARGGSIPLLGL